MPRETVPRDTAVVAVPPEQVARDTIPARPQEAVVDTLQPAPGLPPAAPVPADGWADATWIWSREDLGRWHGLSLLELLESLPGLVVTRAGWFGRPAGLAAFGLGGGRVRVFLDGFELDPLASATFDLQHLAVVDLESVRVERRLAETRVELSSFRLADRRPFSQIEAGTGIFDTRLLRGLFSTPTGRRSVLVLGLDVTDTDGWLRQQPYSASSGIVRWTYAFSDAFGAQLEYRQAGIERTGEALDFVGDRRDLVLRLRARPAASLLLDGTAGRSWRRPGAGDTLGIALSSLQGSLRARFEHGAVSLGAGARLRNADRVGYAEPTAELTAEAGLRPAPWLRASGELRHRRIDEVRGTELEGGLRLGPFAGLSLFAGAGGGDRGVGLARDTLIAVPGTGEAPPALERSFRFPVISTRFRALRVGAEWTGWGLRLGGAYLVHDADSIAPYGLAFDRPAAPVAAEAARGWEAYASIPLFYRPLRLEGSATRWPQLGGRPYLPQHEERLALVFSERFYDGNLEPTLRLETVRRGAALVPVADRSRFGALSEPYTLAKLFLQIRVLDVRAFLIFENLLHDLQAADLPGRPLGGQRAVYGVRWHFYN